MTGAHVYFTLLSDALYSKGGTVNIHSGVAAIYGTGIEHSRVVGAELTPQDVSDDKQARELLSLRVPALDVGRTETPLLIPPFALRAAVAAVVWTLTRRWGRGNWPMDVLRDTKSQPKSLRQIASRLQIDPGHLSRVARGTAILSLPAFTKLLRAAGYRLAVTDSGTEEQVAHFIVSSEWSEKLKESFGDALAIDAPLPTIVPKRGSRESLLYDGFENRYLDEFHRLGDEQPHDEEGLSQILSPTHLYRVSKGERSLSVDMLAAIAARMGLSFLFVPSPVPSLKGIDRPNDVDDSLAGTGLRAVTAPPESWRIPNE